MFSCDFLRFVDISFHFVYISRCVTHSVQRVLVKISFHTSVLICKAKTSVFVNKVCPGRTCKAVRKHSNRLPKDNEFNEDDRCQLSIWITVL